jgi:hypothetical protein
MKKENINYAFGLMGLIFLFYIILSIQTKSLTTKPQSQIVKPTDTTKVEMYVEPVDSSKYYRDSIQIVKKYTSEPNSAGGVDLNIIWKNKSKRTVKYARFEVSAINAVPITVKADKAGCTNLTAAFTVTIKHRNQGTQSHLFLVIKNFTNRKLFMFRMFPSLS